MFDRKTIDKIMAYTMAGLASFLILTIMLSIIAVEIEKKPSQERTQILQNQIKEYDKQIALQKPNENLPDVWPPKMNQIYPDIALFDQAGQEFNLHDLKGKVVIVEYIDMSSPVSQAQSGARTKGVFGILQDVDPYAETFQTVVDKNLTEKIRFPHKDVLQLKIIVYTQDGAQPTRDDASNWARHFGFIREGNVIVAIAKKDLRSQQTQDLVTGYQLVDKNLNLRVDSAGIMPKHNLQTTFMELLPKLLR